MNYRWNLLYFIPILLASLIYLFTGQFWLAMIGILVGAGVMVLLRPGLLPPHIHQAVQLFEQGEVEKALTLVNQSIETNPGRWEAYYIRSLIHFALSNLPAASEDARQAISLKPTIAASHAALGQALAAQADFVAAREAYQQAAQLNSREGLNHYNVGATDFRLQDYEKAIPRLELATKLGLSNPHLNLLAHYYLARALESSGRDNEAQPIYASIQGQTEILERLKQELNQVSDYPTLKLLKQDVAALEIRLANTGR